MHRLEDMRRLEVRLDLYISEISEDGHPSHFLGTEEVPRRGFIPQYRCECGEEFDSWEAARLHINWDDR